MDSKCLENLIEDGHSEMYNEENVMNVKKIQCSEEIMSEQSSCNVSHRLKVKEDVDTFLGSEKSKPTRCLEVFKKPGRRGWLREVILSRVIENLVVQVIYLPPGDNSRKKLQSYKEIETYLAETNDSSLARENFSLSRKFLSLGDRFEITRMSRQVKKNVYKEFYKVIEGSSPVSVSCKLCEGKAVAYTGLSWHMKHYHLPDETCQICHDNIPAIHYSKHSKVCDGAGPPPEVLKLPEVPRIPKIQRNQPAQSKYSKFYTELNDNTFLHVKKARVACNLCVSKAVGYKKHYGRHFKLFHMPDQTCTRCGEDISARVLKNHMNICNGESNTPKCLNDSKDCGELKVLGGNKELDQETDIDHQEEEKNELENKEEINKYQTNDVENPTAIDFENDVTLHEASLMSSSSSSASEIEMFSETDSE